MCEFDTDVKIENYYHHDEEQLMFYKKVHIKTQGIKKDVLVILAQWRTPTYLIKSVLKRTWNAIYNMEKVDLDES